MFNVKYGEIVSVLILLRLWRALRIIHGIVHSVEHRAEKKVHHIIAEKDEVRNMPIEMCSTVTAIGDAGKGKGAQ